MFVESCILDLRPRAKRSHQILRTLHFTAFLLRIRSSRRLSVIGLAQFLLGSLHMESGKGNNLSKLNLVSSLFGHDSRYLLQ